MRGGARTQRKFVRNVSATVVAQVLSLFLAIATGAIIARWLGPEGKGILALGLLLPGMVALLLNGGIGVANVYFVGSKRLDVTTLTGNSLAFALLATILGLVVVLGTVLSGWLPRILPGVPIWLVVVAMLGLPIGIVAGYFGTILQGLQRIISVNMIHLVQAAFGLALTGLFVVGFKMHLLGALVASLGAGVAGLVGLTFLLRREGAVMRVTWNRSVMRRTFSFGLKGHIGNVLQFFNYRLDMFVVNILVGPAAVGMYGVSVRLAELLWYLPNAVAFVIFPTAASTVAQKMNVFTPRVFAITLGLTALGALGLVFLGKLAIELVYSSVFLDAYTPMVVLLPGVVLLGAGKVLTNEIAGRGYPHYNSINAGLALVITIVLDLVLIPRHGIVGAALASSVAYTAVFFTGVGFYLSVARSTREGEVVRATVGGGGETLEEHGWLEGSGSL